MRALEPRGCQGAPIAPPAHAYGNEVRANRCARTHMYKKSTTQGSTVRAPGLVYSGVGAGAQQQHT